MRQKLTNGLCGDPMDCQGCGFCLRDTKLDEFHYHEVIDRLHVLISTLDDHVIRHPVMDKHIEVRLIVETALDKLVEAYQTIGKIDHELNYKEEISCVTK